MVHYLQSWPEFFQATIDRAKRHEVRSTTNPRAVGDNAPTTFATGDTLVLFEFEPSSHKYSGRVCAVTITWIAANPGGWLHPGWVEMSTRLIDSPEHLREQVADNGGSMVVTNLGMIDTANPIFPPEVMAAIGAERQFEFGWEKECPAQTT